MKKQKVLKNDDFRYAHNSNYCMIYPDADERDDDVASTGQS